MKSEKTQIDPLKIIFSPSYQKREAQAQREREAEKIIQRKERHFPMTGAHKQSIRDTAYYGSSGNVFNLNYSDWSY